MRQGAASDHWNRPVKVGDQLVLRFSDRVDGPTAIPDQVADRTEAAAFRPAPGDQMDATLERLQCNPRRSDVRRFGVVVERNSVAFGDELKAVLDAAEV